MAQHIDTAPEAVTPAGQAFDYPADPAKATIVLVNMPCDPQHRNVGLNRAAYDTYIDAQIVATANPNVPGGAAWIVGTDQVLYDPEYNLKAQVSYEVAARRYNYGRITTALGVKWYVFYTPVYVNQTVTRFMADVDEFPSYDWGLGYSMIERGHIAVAASQADTYGANYLTAPEPIDAPPVQGVLASALLGADPTSWTVLVISANDLRGGTGFPFFDRHVNANLIDSADNVATIATIDSNGDVQSEIPTANYPWLAYTGDTPSEVVDTLLPGHTITNPGGTIASGWAWHIANNGGRGGVDLNYNFQTFTAPAAGTVSHFNVAGVGMVVKLVLDTPAPRTSPRQPSGDQPGPMTAIWFQHCSAAVDGHAEEGDVIGTSGDGGGLYSPHLHVHGMIDNGNTASAFNRCNFWGFTTDGTPVIDPFVPKVEASQLSTIDGVPAGGGVYLFTMEGFAEYMTIMQGAPWVTSGIIDVRLVPSWVVGGGGDADFEPQIPSLDPSDDSWGVAAAIPNYVAEVVSLTATPAVLNNWRATVLGAYGATVYRKLVTAPFTDIMVGNGDSTVIFRPDQWPHANIAFQAVSGAAHGEPSIRLIPTGYNYLGTLQGIETPVGGSAGLMHSGFGSAASQVASADMSPYLSAFSSYQSWIVAFRNKQLAVELGLTQIALNAGVQGIQTVMGAVSGAAGGAVGGGGAGAVSGAAMGAIGAIGGLATAGITTSNTIQMLDVSTDGSFDIAAFQATLSGQAAVNTFDAWFQGLFSASGGGTPNRMASGWRAIVEQAFSIVIAMPSTERINALLSEWKRYGYMIGQAFTPPRLDPMTKYTYWKTTGATIIGTAPQEKRESIAQAFDQGTTVWNSLADIGTDVADANTPRAGISY